MAAGGYQLTWNGQTYTLARPELIPAARAVRAFPRMQGLIFSAGGIEWFVWLHQAKAEAEIARAAMEADMPTFGD
jgi:hypothetical protein